MKDINEAVKRGSGFIIKLGLAALLMWFLFELALDYNRSDAQLKAASVAAPAQH